MRLDPRGAIEYLLARGVIDRARVLEDELEILEVSRRNLAFRLRFRGGEGFFLKQLNSTDPRAVASFRREAEIFRLARTHPGFGVVAEVAPPCLGFDPERALLLFRLVDGEPAWMRAVGDTADPGVARLLGEALGRVHREVGWGPGPPPFSGPPTLGPATGGPGELPWILLLPHLPLDPGASPPPTGMTQGTLELVKLVRSNRQLRSLLEGARAAWTPDGLLHGDLKWDNLLLADRIWIADWELAAFGDTAWDVGHVLQAYWSRPLLGGEGGAVPSREGLLIAACSFWEAYRRARGLAPGESRSFLERAVQMGAARCVLTAYEHLHGAPALTPLAWALLQEGSGVFHDPGPTIRALGRAA